MKKTTRNHTGYPLLEERHYRLPTDEDLAFSHREHLAFTWLGIAMALALTGVAMLAIGVMANM